MLTANLGYVTIKKKICGGMKMDFYVDGSYNKNTGYYGWAYVAVKGDSIVHQNSGSSTKANSIWSIAGELSATMNAIKYAYDTKVFSITIYYDYEGIGEWAEGRWRTKNMYTKQYVEFIDKYKNKGMNIKFCKIQGHSGNKYNDIVDKLAGKACGVR